ncbi:MAG: hypothetical protein RJA07_2169 [Bacteroidota bacterium]|jgi:hypothetical protein
MEYIEPSSLAFNRKRLIPTIIIAFFLLLKCANTYAQSNKIVGGYQSHLYYYLENGKKIPLNYKQNIERFNNNRKIDSLLRCNEMCNSSIILHYCVEFQIAKPMEITDSMAALMPQTIDSLQSTVSFQLANHEPIESIDVISSISGKKIDCIVGSKNEQANKLTIDVKCLANGFYTVIVKSKTNKIYYGKLIKQ